MNPMSVRIGGELASAHIDRISQSRKVSKAVIAACFLCTSCSDATQLGAVADSPSACVDRVLAGLGNSSSDGTVPLSRPAVEAMVAAYAFAYGQETSVEAARQQHPSLSRDLEAARLRFESRFRPSLVTIDSVLVSLDSAWQTQWTDAKSQLDEHLASQPISAIDAERFISTIDARTLGMADQSFMQTLLIYHPRYMLRPVEELMDGFSQLYESDGTGKSSGVRMRLSFPASWSGRDGDRPHVVHVFTSEAGRGLASFVIQVRPIGFPVGNFLNDREIEEIIDDPSFGRELMSGGTFSELCSSSTSLDGLPARAVYFRGTIETTVVPVEQIAVLYLTVVGDSLLLLMGAVGDRVRDDSLLVQQFGRFADVFGLIAGSLVVEDRW